MPRGNPENLRVSSPEEARKNGAKGGKASSEARRKKKSLRQALLFLQEQNIGAAWATDPRAKALMLKAGLTEGDCVAMLTAASIINEAVDGNAQMAKIVSDLTASTEEAKRTPAKIVLMFGDNSEETDV